MYSCEVSVGYSYFLILFKVFDIKIKIMMMPVKRGHENGDGIRLLLSFSRKRWFSDDFVGERNEVCFEIGLALQLQRNSKNENAIVGL